MITLDVEDYCQNCENFCPMMERFWISDKVITTIHCEYRVRCERKYNSIKKMEGEKKNGRVG